MLKLNYINDFPHHKSAFDRVSQLSLRGNIE